MTRNRQSNVIREIAILMAVSLLLALAAWRLHAPELPLRADPQVYELDLDYPLITSAEGLDRFTGMEHIFVDTRSAELFKSAHIPGAMNLRSDTFDADLREIFDYILPEDRFVLYGDGNLLTTATVADRLSERGYVNIELLGGGLEQWRNAGGEISGSGGGHE
jgi:rhodanese-related sulfurtransferase